MAEADMEVDKTFLKIIIGRNLVISRCIKGDGINSLHPFIHEFLLIEEYR